MVGPRGWFDECFVSLGLFWVHPPADRFYPPRKQFFGGRFVLGEKSPDGWNETVFANELSCLPSPGPPKSRSQLLKKVLRRIGTHDDGCIRRRSYEQLYQRIGATPPSVAFLAKAFFVFISRRGAFCAPQASRYIRTPNSAGGSGARGLVESLPRKCAYPPGPIPSFGGSSSDRCLDLFSTTARPTTGRPIF